MSKLNHRYANSGGGDDGGNDNFGEGALWKAVIMQAIVDAVSNNKDRKYKSIRLKAIAWLTSEDEDFERVCRWADLDPVYVRRKALKAIKNSRNINLVKEAKFSSCNL